METEGKWKYNNKHAIKGDNSEYLVSDICMIFSGSNFCQLEFGRLSFGNIE